MEYGDARLPERFWVKVIPEPMSGCWLWIGAESTVGYGRFRDGQRLVQAHRTVMGEPPSPGLVARHTCDTRLCVNPGHLLWGTARDNTQDMLRRGRGRHSGKTGCPHGHLYDFTTRRGHRGCRRCMRAAVRRSTLRAVLAGKR